MQTIGDYGAHINRHKRLHHRAMPHTTTPAQRAQYVAASIALREDAGAARTWGLYGLQDNLGQQQLVLAALAGLRGEGRCAPSVDTVAGEVPAPLPLVALVAQRDALIAQLAARPDAAGRAAVREQLTAVLVEIDRRYGR